MEHELLLLPRALELALNRKQLRDVRIDLGLADEEPFTLRPRSLQSDLDMLKSGRR